jgi:hypothetical protein
MALAAESSKSRACAGRPVRRSTVATVHVVAGGGSGGDQRREAGGHAVVACVPEVGADPGDSGAEAGGTDYGACVLALQRASGRQARCRLIRPHQLLRLDVPLRP